MERDGDGTYKFNLKGYLELGPDPLNRLLILTSGFDPEIGREEGPA